MDAAAGAAMTAAAAAVVPVVPRNPHGSSTQLSYGSTRERIPWLVAQPLRNTHFRTCMEIRTKYRQRNYINMGVIRSIPGFPTELYISVFVNLTSVFPRGLPGRASMVCLAC